MAGGSTIVCLFEKNVVEWDKDLLVNGCASLETLVRVGTGQQALLAWLDCVLTELMMHVNPTLRVILHRTSHRTR